MKAVARMMVRTKSLRLSILTALFVFLFPICFSMAGSNRSLPPGDYIFNSKSGDYEPFYPDSERKVTDFVSDCDNSPGLQRNADQLGFIKTAIMGKDNRCPFFFDENANEEDKALYGVGEIFDFSRRCHARGGGICSGTGHLVIDEDFMITAAHVFLNHIDGEKDKYSDGKGFKFSAKVWIPEKLRKKSDEPYEWRSYEIQEVQYGSLNPRDPDHKDYAFVKLKEPVGVLVGKKGAQGKIGKKVVVDRRYWPKPLPFKPLDDSRFSKPIQMVSLADQNSKIKDSPFYKNCKPFRIYTDPHSHLGPAFSNVLIHDGDTLDGSSGSALVVPDEQGVLTYNGVNIGGQILPTETEEEGNFHIENRRNFAIDGNSFYDEFMRFRRKFGRSESNKMARSSGSR